MPTKTSDASNGRATAVAPVTNLAEFTLAASEPYRVTLTLQGTSTMLFHRWNCEAVDAKANDEGELCIPGEYVRQSIAGPAGAAKFRQDPRSSRKSALDLYKAGVVSLTELASLGVKDWDMLDQRRVTVQRAGITRMRPAMLAGWRAEFDLQVLLPEYIPPMDLLDVITRAGQLVGIGDFRPTYGRFAVVRFEIVP
jgi:hypothetical protein